MSHSMFKSELSNKVDCTQTSSTTDTVSPKLLASGFTPPSNKEAEIKALRSANCELQARLSGYLVFRECCLFIYLCIFSRRMCLSSVLITSGKEVMFLPVFVCLSVCVLAR